MTRKDARHREVGGSHRARTRYYILCNRVKNTQQSKNSCYEGIQVLVSKDEFIRWFMMNDFTGCSVDRIDKGGHYELSNMQLIPLAQNIAKDKLVSKDGMSRCYVCRNVKPLDQFVSETRRIATGKSTICKECERARTRLKGARKIKCNDKAAGDRSAK